MKSENDFYVYVHKADDGHIFYVGKGSGRRAWTTKNRSEKWRTMFSTLCTKLSVEIVYSGLNESDAYKKELELIRLNMALHELANIADNGRGPGLQQRLKLSESKKGIAFWPKGKKRPPEFGRMVSDRLRGKSLSPEHVEKNRIARSGKKHSMGTVEKMREIRKFGTHNSKPIIVCGWYVQSMTALAKFVGVTPLCVKKWVDSNKQDRIDEAFRRAFRAT